MFDIGCAAYGYIAYVFTVSARHSEGPPFSVISSCDNLRLGIQLGLGSVVWLSQYQELFPATTTNDGVLYYKLLASLRSLSIRPSVCMLSIRHWYCVKMTQARIMRSSLTDIPRSKHSSFGSIRFIQNFERVPQSDGIK